MLFLPASALIWLWAAEVRDVFVAPVATAEADSATTIVTRSSACAARTSLPISVRREAGDHREPADGWTGADCCLSASCRYLSNALTSDYGADKPKKAPEPSALDKYLQEAPRSSPSLWFNPTTSTAAMWYMSMSAAVRPVWRSPPKPNRAGAVAITSRCEILPATGSFRLASRAGTKSSCKPNLPQISRSG